MYGLIGTIVFMGVLAYLIVRYRAFNIKLIGAQALVFTLVILIGAQLFSTTSRVDLVITLITLLLAVGFGYLLIRSVKREVERKEELQRISDALAVANEKLKALDTAKTEFISIASHQLRTPLTAVKGYVSLLLEGAYGKLPSEVEDVMNKVYTVNTRLTQLVEDLLNVSRIELGRVQYALAPARLEAIVMELVDTFALAAKGRGLALKMRLPKEALPELTIDSNKMREVVSNLIDNALKYTKEGGVTVALERDAAYVRIIVSDTGIGIRPGDRERLFTKFTRSQETSKMETGGTGLGLYVGKNFVEGHHGRIWAESDGSGKGSRFIVELPLEHSAEVTEGLG